MTKEKEKLTGLELLREDFPDNQISKLPKPTKKQTDTLRDAMKNGDFSLGIRCAVCGGWHHKDVIHLDYVGHAALTDRLLDCDPSWNWEPVAFDENGVPVMDNIGGMWIRLTVCDVTRLGYGHPDGKTGGNAIKEIIGDALRNAAMRFGAALNLWHKGELHVDEDEAPKSPPKKEEPKHDPKPSVSPVEISTAIANINAIQSIGVLRTYWTGLVKNQCSISRNQDVLDAKNTRKTFLDNPIPGDEIPY